MEGLPADVCLKIFCLLDHQNLATAQQVCRRWKVLGADNNLWSNLFEERWGRDHAVFYAPIDAKSWKDVYEVQDRCDRVGLGLKIIREGGDYYLVHQGEIQRHLGSRRPRKGANAPERDLTGEGSLGEEPSSGILDKILFFIGDLEAASASGKRSREA
ncbi:F-box/WD repeat-containing protein [Actinidia chinensis var. chinensis]|uniref:F-box protein n=1 Tax=Actinidia chinensis var. chinensis TaxID=1590841 RepID=A0A2R6Q9A8_ACTCC|nr:F-box/WD repeat-containing protein [Actinidia chinensis var. chinensis]